MPFLENGSRLGFVITQTVFKTRGAGDGFRRFKLGSGAPLKAQVADDMTELKPFEGAANRTATVVLEKGQPTTYPVTYQLWKRAVAAAYGRRDSPGERSSPLQNARSAADVAPASGRQKGQRDAGATIPYDADLDQALALTTRLALSAEPVEPGKPTSPWLTAPAGAMIAARKAGGRSGYKAWEGSNTGGLNGAYWITIAERRADGLLTVENLGEVGKIKVPVKVHPLEPDLVYPLLRGRDVERWRATPSAYIILAQDPKARTGYRESWMKTRLPQTYRYFKQFEPALRNRSGYRKYFDPQKDAFYSMYNVGPYTLAPYKIVWREQAAELTCAVVASAKLVDDQRPVVPDHKLMLVGLSLADEAHYLCAVLNSSAARVAVKGYVVETQTSVHVLEHIGVPKFDGGNPVHANLAELSQRAHELAARVGANPNDEDVKRELAKVEDEVDRAAAELWGLTDAELEEIRKALQVL